MKEEDVKKLRKWWADEYCKDYFDNKIEIYNLLDEAISELEGN